ncbi:MAG: threonylcarbamoyl-AMP synthase [Oscillospiraceae bacterium]|jgi:L-threonylcarbamoyladenylate synthase|nr:threonylcarbamoyl-AMP synthase [Oscillospiraceae bacterium]
MQILKAGERGLQAGELDLISSLLHAGEAVVIPTETVYGLAANALDARAVENIFRIKGRPSDNPLIVHISDEKMLGGIVTEVPPAAKKLMKRFWPGPLTLVLTKKNESIPAVVSAGLGTIAVRMPNHPVELAIIEHSKLPLAAPSANLSGYVSPTTAKHCVSDLAGRISLIVDGGSCVVGVESTVLFVAEKPYRILRSGIITKSELEDAGEIEIEDVTGSSGECVCSPGVKYKHYSPKAKVTLIDGDLAGFRRFVSDQASEHACVMVFAGEGEGWPCRCFEYGAQNDPGALAQSLFATLRMADEMGLRRVFVRAPDVNYAVYDRLKRASLALREEFN